MNSINLGIANYFVLYKQHLTDVSKTDDFIQSVKDSCGLHATNPVTPYLSLFSRSKNFTKVQLDKELYVRRSLGKMRFVRTTVFILPKDMISIAYSSTKNMAQIASERYSQYLGVTQKEYNGMSKLILEVLKGKGRTVKEIKTVLKTDLNVSAIVNLMCDKGLLIRGKPRAGWKSNIHTYNVFQDVFPDIDLNAVEETKAKKSVVRQYLASFGPVTKNDIAWWTGFSKGEVVEILESLCKQIVLIKISDLKGVHLILRSDLRYLQSLKPEKGLVSLLPGLDPYLMGYKDRERYLKLKYYNYIFDRSGNATSTIILDGKAIGIWDISEKPEPFVKIFFFEEVEDRILNRVYIIAKKLGKFIIDRDVQIKECDSMTPLTHRTAGGVISPLKNC